MNAPADPSHGDTPVRPTVSVVVPCFNYARFVMDAITSALTQQGVNVEIIVVDDASTDDSLAVARAASEKDARVKVVAHATNRGPVETFNDGLAQATGEFLVRLDADDLLTPGSLARAVEVCRAHPSVGLVYGRPLHFADHRARPRTGAGRPRVWRGMDWLATICRDGHNVITSPEALVRMSVVARVGGQRALPHTHDMEMWLRVAAFSDVAYIRGVDQAWHREHADSLSARQVDTLRDLRERVAAFAELRTGVAGGRPGVADLVDTALAALAREALTSAEAEIARHGSSSPLVRDFLTVAGAADPTLVGGKRWRRLERGGRPRPGALSAIMFGRLRRRVQSVIRRQRWQRTGIWG